MSGEKWCSVMAVTERPAGSAMLILPMQVREGERHENDLRDYGPCFRLHDRHGRNHDNCADRVMRDLLIFLGRGFALFAGGRAAIYQYPALSRSAVVVEAQKHGRGPSE
jgi:hypothetical protein